MTDEQVRRLAAQREELIATGWLTLTELAERRGEPDVGTVGGWVAARRLERALIALDPRDGTIRVPAFQITAGGDPRPELRPLLEVLLGAGIGGWAAWAWLTSPSSFLSGDVPEQVATTDPTRALNAATRFVQAVDA
ncbi:hypothetical protein [Blastococcus sp. TF02A-30]|uniref:hypothetical protein n=1 Tax=Blastococcus sp. TF02A-30 TaxID=2250580 RepID=UPI000DEAA890|nr:hypothetical protein [Blastococcus sp. TF02A-30]RBY86451.1 hypothetical protein DQ241_13025 [Blastococcus sp. TF02A-30]